MNEAELLKKITHMYKVMNSVNELEQQQIILMLKLETLEYRLNCMEIKNPLSLKT